MCPRNGVSLEVAIFPASCNKQTRTSYIGFSKISLGLRLRVLNRGYMYAALC